MEGRFLVLFLTLTLVVGTLTGCGRDQARARRRGGQPPVIEPDVERREIEPAKIDTEDFEVGIFAGRDQRRGFRREHGLRRTIRLSRDGRVLRARSTAGQADTELTSFERLSGAAQLLTDEQRQYSYYNVSLGYNIFPGESFVGGERSLNTSTYVIGGVGKTTFAGDDRFTVNLGMGIRLMPLDWLAVHADIRDHIFDIDLLGQEKTAHNVEAHVGVTFFF